MKLSKTLVSTVRPGTAKKSAPPIVASKPGKPGKPGNVSAKATAPSAKPGKPGAPIVVRPTRDTVTAKATPIAAKAVDASAAILAQLQGLKNELAKTQEKLAKNEARARKTSGFTFAELSEGINLPKSDWRKDWIQERDLHFFTMSADGSCIPDLEKPIVPCAIVVPRDVMSGGSGARSAGFMAVLSARCEDGSWDRKQIAYLTADELGSIWPE